MQLNSGAISNSWSIGISCTVLFLRGIIVINDGFWFHIMINAAVALLE